MENPNKSTNFVLDLRPRDGAVVARWAHNPKVAGSSPAPATKKERMEIRLGFSFYLSYVIFKKINEIKPAILTAADSLGNKFSTSAIKLSETSGNGIVCFITKFKIFNPLVGFLSFTLL